MPRLVGAPPLRPRKANSRGSPTTVARSTELDFICVQNVASAFVRLRKLSVSTQHENVDSRGRGISVVFQMEPSGFFSMVPCDMTDEYSKGQKADLLATEKVYHERKIFFLDLKENQRGRLLKITEDVAGRRNTLMIPVEALKEFEACVVRLMEFEGKL
jgi:hypothetical protein